MLLVLLTSFIFCSYYSLFLTFNVRPIHQKIILGGLLTCAQIVLTELLLGVLGVLYLYEVVLVNSVISIDVFLYVFVIKKSLYLIKEDMRRFGKGIQSIVSLANTALLFLTCYLILWIAASIYFLPPRDWDDLVYHLTPIYEYIIHHQVFLMADFYPHFAFPQNAEFLFMWPAILSHSQRWVTAVPLFISLWTVVIIYGLARTLEIKPKDAFYISVLFLFSPMIMFNMGLNYIDSITAAFFLVSLFVLFMFLKTQSIIYFYLMALACGLLLGMKYTMAIPISLLILYLFGSKVSLKHWFVFLLLLFIPSGFWYLRNIYVLHNPIYPIHFLDSNMGIFYREAHPQSTYLFWTDIPKKLLLLWRDNGNYGVLFWGIAFPCLIWTYWKGFSQKMWVKSAYTLIFISFIVGVLELMLIPLADFYFSVRYSMFLIGLGVLSIGLVLTTYGEFLKKFIKGLCICLALLSLILMGKEHAYWVNRPIKDFIQGRYLTGQNYIDSRYKPVWALLDYLTLEDSKGINCYITKDIIDTSPLYGTYLQNRIWNFLENKTSKPDAFLYLRSKKQLSYYGSVITPAEVKKDPNYIVALETKYLTLFLSKDLMRNPQKRERYEKVTGKKLMVI